MSPIYERARQVDRTEIDAIKLQVDGDYPRMVQEGFAFLVQDGVVSKITPFEEIPDGVWMNAERKNGDWRILLPLAGSNESRVLYYLKSKNDGKFCRGGGEGHKYRGKHSSHVKGKGFMDKSSKFDSLNVSKNR